MAKRAAVNPAGLVVGQEAWDQLTAVVDRLEVVAGELVEGRAQFEEYLPMLARLAAWEGYTEKSIPDHIYRLRDCVGWTDVDDVANRIPGPLRRPKDETDPPAALAIRDACTLEDAEAAS